MIQEAGNDGWRWYEGEIGAHHLYGIGGHWIREKARMFFVDAANTSLTSRTATIAVTGEGQKRMFFVIQEGAGITAIPEREGYELVWHDEFTEGTELNATHWRHEVQNAGWVNTELQNYVDGVVNGKRVTEM